MFFTARRGGNEERMIEENQFTCRQVMKNGIDVFYLFFDDYWMYDYCDGVYPFDVDVGCVTRIYN